MKKTTLMLLITMVFTAPGCFLVKNIQAMDFHEIKAKELKAKFDAGEKLLLINPLSDIEFNAKHIPGSVNIPLQNILITEQLPKDKDQLIITYCLGPKCIVSMDAARLLAKRGYTNIMVFTDGIPGWLKEGYAMAANSTQKKIEVKSIEATELNKTIDDYIIVDIRPESTYKIGYLPDSRAMPMTYLSILSVELPKDRRIMIVDHSGKRCKKAAQWLLANGFEDVSILEDGLTGFANAGFALEN